MHVVRWAHRRHFLSVSMSVKEIRPLPEGGLFRFVHVFVLLVLLLVLHLQTLKVGSYDARLLSNVISIIIHKFTNMDTIGGADKFACKSQECR